MASLSCGYWNIHGHNSELIGDKLSDPEFLHMVKNVDILGLGELHAESFVSIPGFVRIKQKIREKNLRVQKWLGGSGYLFVQK